MDGGIECGGGADNTPTAIVVKNDGNVYVTGESTGIDTGKDFGTVMSYSQTIDTTDTDPPVVDAVTPEEGSVDIVVTSLVTAALFNEAMDVATITGATFTVTETNSGSPVPES